MKMKYLPILLILLTACAGNPPPTGTGGYDPNALAWSLAGTSTAVSASINSTGTAVAASINSTAVAANATQAAIFARSTAIAQSTAIQSTAIAQATQAQGTAVAAATSTEQAQLDSAQAIGQMTRDAIQADALKVEMAATATAIQARANADAARAERAASTAVFWQWFRWVLLGAFGLFCLTFIPVLGRLIYYRWLPDDTAVIDGNGNILAIHRNYQLPARTPALIIDQPRQPPIPPAERVYVVTIPAVNGMPEVEIATPEPRNFREWLADVLDEESRVQFSQNEAKTRGWDDGLFWGMVKELKKAGWLQAKPDGNGVYRLNDAGKKRAKNWLGIGNNHHSPTGNGNGRQTVIEGKPVSVH